MLEFITAVAALLSAGSAIHSATQGTPKIPTPEPPPAPPTIDEATKRQEEEAKLRRRRGRASTILTGPQGAGTPVTATKTLLGS